jgi:hypothetical protein
MRRTTAAVYFENGRPLGYSLFCEGQDVDPQPIRGITPVITTFQEAYGLFDVVRANYTADGMPVEE